MTLTIRVVVGGSDWAMQVPPGLNLLDPVLVEKVAVAIEGIKGLLGDQGDQ